MDAVAGLHALPGLILAGGLVVLAAVAAALAVARRPPLPWLDAVRTVALAIVVIEAALGLVLAFRGRTPDEWIHWLYGGIIIAALLLPAAIVTDGSPRSRSAALAGAAGLAAVLAWRLWGSG